MYIDSTIDKLRSRFSGVYSPFPLSSVSSTLNTNACYTSKLVLPCSSFTRIRVGYLNPHSVTISGVNMLVAATETLASDTSTALSLPVVAGTAVTDVDSTSHADGWRTVTKNGATSLTLPSGTTHNRGIFWSDWIDVRSVTPTSGNFAALLVRAYIPGATYNYKTATIANSSTTASVKTTENGGWLAQSAFHTGASSTEPTTGTATLSDNHLPLVIEFETTDRVVTVMTVGDQVFECNAALAAESKDIRTNWAFRACRESSGKDTSGKGLYFSPVNFGMSGQTQETFNTNTYTFLDYTSNPSIVVTQGWSQNDFSSLTTTAGQQVKERVQHGNVTEMFGLLEDRAILAIGTTATPYSLGTTYSESSRRKYNNRIRSIAPVYLTKMDFAELTGSTYGNPETWKTGYLYDADMLTNKGIEVLKSDLKAILAEIF